MNTFIAVQYDYKTDRLMPSLAPDGGMAVYTSVQAAEAAIGGDVNSISVYDTSKKEVPMPLVAPGTPVLVDGQWTVSK